MDALDTPAPKVVSTYFTGDIVDLVHHHFTHKHWKRLQPFHTLILPTILQQHSAQPAAASASTAPSPPHTAATDSIPAAGELGPQSTVVAPASSRPLQASSASLLLPPPAPSPLGLALSRCRYVFLRWKERYFICGEGGSLSISGSYFLAVDRVTGEVQGYYCDKRKSAPSHRSIAYTALQHTQAPHPPPCVARQAEPLLPAAAPPPRAGRQHGRPHELP